MRRPGSSVPPGSLRPTASEGRRTSSLLLAPRCPPMRIRSPSTGLSRGRPPPNDRHRGVAVLMGGYFAQPLSQPRPLWVAVRLPRQSAVPPDRARRPALSRREASASACTPSGSTPVPWRRGPVWHSRGTAALRHLQPRSTGVAARSERPEAGACERLPTTARPSGPGSADGPQLPERAANPRTRVALRNRFGPRIPHDTNPGAGPLRARRHLEIDLQPPPDPAPAPGDRGPRVLLLHPAPAAQGPGGAAGPGLGASRWGTRCRPSAASSAPCSRSTVTATRS